jgi:hypothetical protein
MPFLTVKLQPGVKAIQTPTLLAANVVLSNLIRWRGGLAEKLGGWMNFFSNVGTTGGPSDETIGGISRELCAWADLDLTNRLAIAGTAGLNALTITQNGTPSIQGITPAYVLTTSGQTVSTIAGSPVVPITDPGAQLTAYGGPNPMPASRLAASSSSACSRSPVLTAQYEITLPSVAATTTASVSTASRYSNRSPTAK